MTQNAVFISYCRTDANGATASRPEVALAIRDALVARTWTLAGPARSKGRRLLPKKIRRYINTCSVFSAVDFRDHGARARTVSSGWNGVALNAPAFHRLGPAVSFSSRDRQHRTGAGENPEEFRRIHCTQLRDGNARRGILDRVQMLYQKARTSRGLTDHVHRSERPANSI